LLSIRFPFSIIESPIIGSSSIVPKISFKAKADALLFLVNNPNIS